MSSDPRHAMEPRFGTTNDANRARSHLSHLGRWTAHSTIAVALTRSQNQQVVAADGGDLERALRALLALDVPEVETGGR